MAFIIKKIDPKVFGKQHGLAQDINVNNPYGALVQGEVIKAGTSFTGVVIKETGHIDISDIIAEVTTPLIESIKHNPSTDDYTITFSSGESSTAGDFVRNVIEYSESDSFESIEEIALTDESALTATFNLDLGKTYYFRIKTEYQDAISDYSEIAQHGTRFITVSFPSNIEFSKNTENFNRVDVSFSKGEIDGNGEGVFQENILELSNISDDFSNPIHTQSINSGETVNIDLNFGQTYYFRIKSIYTEEGDTYESGWKEANHDVITPSFDFSISDNYSDIEGNPGTQNFTLGVQVSNESNAGDFEKVSIKDEKGTEIGSFNTLDGQYVENNLPLETTKNIVVEVIYQYVSKEKNYTIQTENYSFTTNPSIENISPASNHGQYNIAIRHGVSENAGNFENTEISINGTLIETITEIKTEQVIANLPWDSQNEISIKTKYTEKSASDSENYTTPVEPWEEQIEIKHDDYIDGTIVPVSTFIDGNYDQTVYEIDNLGPQYLDPLRVFSKKQYNITLVILERYEPSIEAYVPIDFDTTEQTVDGDLYNVYQPSGQVGSAPANHRFTFSYS